jgi:hypothetical protein
LTSSPDTTAPAPTRPSLSPLELTAIGLWGAVLIVLVVLRVFHPEKGSVLPTYVTAGHHWLMGERIYTVKGGFVYSPLVAAFFAPFSMLPANLSAIVWLLVNTGLYLGAAAWWVRVDLHGLGRAWSGAFFLALLPLTIGNLHNGQINPADIALIMAAILCARSGRWNLCALCVAIATYAKIYPLAAGLLLIVVYPRELGWRIAVALLLLGALSLVLQKPAYALDQYHQWWATRMNDDRHGYDPKTTPRDFWKLLVVLHVPIGATLYKCLQLATAGGLALLCLLAPRRGWSRDRLLIGLFTLVCCWMLLFGPATESATYVLLAPAISLALMSAVARSFPVRLRATVVVAYAMLLLGLSINSFTGIHRLSATMIIQPAATLIFLIFSMIWLFDKTFWTPEPAARTSASPP